jgi:mevalonate kinase
LVSVTASAPGKLMLLGEHAVVYDRPCLVTALDLRVRVTVSLTQDDDITIDTPNLRAARQDYRVASAALKPAAAVSFNRETAFLEAAAAQVFDHYGVRAGLVISTDGPRKSFGLGSSSAVTVAAVAALAQLFDQPIDNRELFDMAYAAVIQVQGKGSGFDVASAVYGGTLYFLTGGSVIEPLPIEDLPIMIGYSGQKVSTTDHIERVAELRRRQPVVDQVFDVMSNLVGEARQHLVRRDWTALGDLLNINQGLLDSLGVNTPQLAALIFASREAGALGAKLSGAGGGDCMFALVDDPGREAVERAVQQAGGEVVVIGVNATGVRIE